MTKDTDDLELLVRKIAKCERLMKKPGAVTNKLQKKRAEYVLKLGEIAYQAALASSMNLTASPTTVTEKLDPTKFSNWNDSLLGLEHSETSIEGPGDFSNLEFVAPIVAIDEDKETKTSCSGIQGDHDKYLDTHHDATRSLEQFDENEIGNHEGVQGIGTSDFQGDTRNLDEMDQGVALNEQYENHDPAKPDDADTNLRSTTRANAIHDKVTDHEKRDEKQTFHHESSSAVASENEPPSKEIIAEPQVCSLKKDDDSTDYDQNTIDAAIDSSAAPLSESCSTHDQNTMKSTMIERMEILEKEEIRDIGTKVPTVTGTEQPPESTVDSTGSSSVTSYKESEYDGEGSVSKLRAIFDSPTEEKPRRSWRPKKVVNVPPAPPLTTPESTPKCSPQVVMMQVQEGFDQSQSMVTLQQAVMTSSVHDIDSPLVALVSLFPESMYEYLPKQNRALIIFKVLGIEPIYVDGSNPEERDRRDELFRLSGKRGVYPQLFIRKQGRLEFFADFDKIEYLNDCQTLKEELDAACQFS